MPRMFPNLWFNGNAREAVDFYLSVFKGGKVYHVTHYPGSSEEGLADFQKHMAGKIFSIEFEINGMRLVAINGSTAHQFTEAISFMVYCKNQEEIDYYWDAFVKNGGKEEKFGWLKDKFGVSWQICPENWKLISQKPTSFKKLMNMTKIILAEF